MFNKEGKKRRRKRISMSLDMKLKIIKSLDTEERISVVARTFGLNESTVRSIKKRRELIRNTAVLGSFTSTQCASYTRNPLLENMERVLMGWIENNRRNNIPTGALKIRRKALSILNALKKGQDSSVVEKLDYFTASTGWYHKFKKRYSLQNLSLNDDSQSAGKDSVENNLSQIARIAHENEYTSDQVFATDLTTLLWKKAPDKITTKDSKDLVTVLFCCNASGDILMQPLILSQGNYRTKKMIAAIDLPVYWTAVKRGVLTAEIVRIWFEKCFIPDVELYMLEKDLPFKALLLLSNLPDYQINLEHPNIKVMFSIPGTPVLDQRLHPDLITTFKINYIQRTLKDIVQKLDSDEKMKVSEAWDKYSTQDSIKNISLALRHFTKANLNACWKTLWPEIVTPGNALPTIEEEIESIINLSRGFGCYDKLNERDIYNLITDGESSNSAIIPLKKSENHYNEEISDSDSDESSFNPDNLYNVLQLATRLETAVMKMDSNVRRVLKFRKGLKKCCSVYQEIFENLTKSEEEFENKSESEITIKYEHPYQNGFWISSPKDGLLPFNKEESKHINFNKNSDSS